MLDVFSACYICRFRSVVGRARLRRLSGIDDRFLVVTGYHRAMCRVAVLVLAFLVSAAGRHRRQYHVESVTRGRDGNIWVSGTDGLAGYFGRSGFTRADYRCGRRDFRGAYHTYMDMPASQIALYRGEPILFTRRGEVSRWGADHRTSFW